MTGHRPTHCLRLPGPPVCSGCALRSGRAFLMQSLWRPQWRPAPCNRPHAKRRCRQCQEESPGGLLGGQIAPGARGLSASEGTATPVSIDGHAAPAVEERCIRCPINTVHHRVTGACPEGTPLHKPGSDRRPLVPPHCPRAVGGRAPWGCRCGPHCQGPIWKGTWKGGTMKVIQVM